MLRLHNSLTGKVEQFIPMVPGQVRMYVCGITVYDYCHLGHMRMMVVFDVVRRWLRASGYAVTFVRNITDIDDKIIQRAAANHEPIDALTSRFIAAMDEDGAQLGIERPDHEPRATAYVPQIIAMIQRLIEREHAYVASSGDVLYAVASFQGYGALSGKNTADLRAGARVDVEESKRDPLDFVLWKRAKPGEPSWPSPWGDGRPGWHIECSAMSTALLGDHFDIHGGGMDLKFPHHENEIAQSCGATGHRFVNYWMHNGFVYVVVEKMYKSLGNFFTVREILPRLRHPEVLRFFLLGSHYRGPINYSLEQLQQADAALGRLYLTLRGLPVVAAPVATPWHARFATAMDEDFNTPEALAVLQMLAREINTCRAAGRADEAASLAAVLAELAQPLGVLQLQTEVWCRASLPGEGDCSEGPSDTDIQMRVDARLAARKARDFAESDRLRDELAELGVLLEDQPGGITVWRRR